MPRRCKDLNHFFLEFTYDEAFLMVNRLERQECLQRNLADGCILNTVLYTMALEFRRSTGSDHFDEGNVKLFVRDNMMFYRKFVAFVNENPYVKYNVKKNRVSVAAEYFSTPKKEHALHRIFRQHGFPFFDVWARIIEFSNPGAVDFYEVGSRVEAPIVVMEDPFDALAVSDMDREWGPLTKKFPIHDDKLI